MNIMDLRRLAIWLNALEINLLIYFFQSKLHKRKYKMPVYICSIIIFTQISYCVNLLGIPILNISFLILYMTIVSLLLYNVRIKEIFVKNLYFVLLILIVDILVSAVFSVFDDSLTSSLINDEHFFYQQ